MLSYFENEAYSKWLDLDFLAIIYLLNVNLLLKHKKKFIS